MFIGVIVWSLKLRAFLTYFRGSFMNLKSMTNHSKLSFLKSSCSSRGIKKVRKEPFIIHLSILYFPESSQAFLVPYTCNIFWSKNSPVLSSWLFCIHYLPWCLWRETEVRNGSTQISSNSTISLSPCSHIWFVSTLHIILQACIADKGKIQDHLFLPNFFSHPLTAGFLSL